MGKIRSNLLNQFWNIGFVEEPINEVVHAKELNIHWLKHPYKDRWFADPFILSASDKEIVVLVEEFQYSTSKGRIAKLVIDKASYKLKEMVIILELPTHLSFPFIYRQGSDIYIMPENGASGSSTIYRYNQATDELLKVSVVLQLPLTDAIIHNVNGNDYLFSTMQPSPNRGPLKVYAFDKDALKSADMPISEIGFDLQISRNAGAMFEVDGQLYRPAQDCVKCYGNGIILQHVNYKGGRFTCDNINSFYSRNSLYDLGYHTFNMKDGLIVIDGHGRSKYWIINKVIDILKGF